MYLNCAGICIFDSHATGFKNRSLSEGCYLKVVLAFLSIVVFFVAGCGNISGDRDQHRVINAGSVSDPQAAKMANEIGLRHLNNDKLDLAADEFSRAINADAEYGPAHNNLGKVYFKQKDWYKAAWEFEYARQYMPKNPQPLNNLGLVHENTGELDKAVEYYRQAIGLDPDNVEYIGNLARALVKRGDKTDEVRSLLKILIEKDKRPKWRIWAERQYRSIENSSN